MAKICLKKCPEGYLYIAMLQHINSLMQHKIFPTHQLTDTQTLKTILLIISNLIVGIVTESIKMSRH